MTVKCDECRADMREAETVGESARGGICDNCLAIRYAKIAEGQVRSMRLAAMVSIGVVSLPGDERVIVRLKAGKANRTAEIKYDRRADTYTVKRATMQGRRAATHTLDVFEHVYTDSLATVLTAGGFDGSIS